MPAPTAADVSAFLGKPGDAETEALATQHLPILTQQVKAYVRGNGFNDLEHPTEDLAAVIVSACARSIGNPEAKQSTQVALDDFNGATRYGVFNGWTLPELAILHRYRKRAL
ncbi:hypothetical protein FXB39_00610 [Nocardioides sp. BGMRC 2183]|nr:hypothetical protein FXB39_00610 [Nocardioides sp. BGMRC 2183]